MCGRKLTIGVSHRVEQLADRPEGYLRENRSHFESLVPLPEVIGSALGNSSASGKVQKEYMNMLRKLGPEFGILRELPLEDIRSVSGTLISEGIRKLRRGEVQRIPGFDGEYGEIRLFTQRELDALDGQMSLFVEGFPETAQDVQRGRTDGGSQVSRAGKNEEIKEQAAESGRLKEQAAENGRPKEQLNEKQQQAIRSMERVTAVVAGPGTGKTKTLISRMVYLLENRRVKPSNMTAVTFTNQAAGEPADAYQGTAGQGGCGKKIQIGTFHSVARKLLKDRGAEFTWSVKWRQKRLRRGSSGNLIWV